MMLGKMNQPPCGSKCCGRRDKAHKRQTKRTERMAWKKEISR